jgi:hypothetical protein
MKFRESKKVKVFNYFLEREREIVFYYGVSIGIRSG